MIMQARAASGPDAIDGRPFGPYGLDVIPHQGLDVGNGWWPRTSRTVLTR
jgi:hypothetical protein